MRILAVSVAPLFPDRIMGGSQRILLEVVDALVLAGHEVRVLSSRTSSHSQGFRIASGALVEPALDLRGSFPAPYQTAPHSLTSAWQVLQENAAWADRAYLHADAVYFRSALGDMPVIRSLHDYVYEEALLSAFTLPAARTIVPSQYVKDCIESSAGLVSDTGELIVVPNGVATSGWPVESMLPDGIKSRQEADMILLHPHRLQPEKGIRDSLRIAVEMKRRMPRRRIRLLVPALQPEGSADDAELGDTSVLELASSLGAEDLLELHAWLPSELMPGYFAAGDVTLCPGSFVEAFGLVSLESVVAGTPAVCARVGALREQQGIPGVTHFDYGDVQEAAEAVLSAMNSGIDAQAAAHAVTERYDITRMRESYVEAITGALPALGPARRRRGLTDPNAWKLAPWCYLDGDRIYHDYLARFEQFPAIAPLLKRHAPFGIPAELFTSGRPASELESGKKQGFVVPA